ncbi:MAG: hypothetical protein R2762_03095 [Bryobacteraceae bacterium]
MRRLFHMAVSMTLPGLLAAQVSLVGPRSGFVFDEIRGEVRPVIGEPGGAYLGRAVALEIAPKQMEIRNGGAIAIAIAEADGAPSAWRVTGLADGAPELLPLGPATRVELDPAGRMALLFTEETVRLVTGLEKEPVPGPEVALASLPGVLSPAQGAVAFQHEPGCAIAAARSENATALVMLCADAPGEPRVARWLEGVDIARMIYLEAQGGLWMADRTAARVLRVHGAPDSGELETMAEGVSQAAGIQAVSRDEVAVAQEDGWLAIVSIRERGVTGYLELPALPDRLDYLVPGRILVCTRLRRDPVLVIDLGQDRASFFIPMPGGAR